MNNNQPVVLGGQTKGTGTILVIDELLLVSSALAYTLQGKGFDAHSLRVTNVKAMQEAALAFVPGLVLLDLDLGAGPDVPPIDSVDLIGPLCAQGWTVMVMTGTVRVDRIADAIAQGAANWIVKGATFAELVHASEQIMAEGGQPRQVERAALIDRHRP
jgi:DNA-binding NtrC family response regulator